MGSIQPSKMNDDEDEDPEILEGNGWKQLLNNDGGVYSVKSWEEVIEMKANKANIGLACREIMRQAWSEYNINNSFLYSTLVI